VAILCRNHVGALMAVFAAAKAGSRVVVSTTGSAPPQVRRVCAREGIEAILLDDDLTAVIAELPSDLAPWGA
jgi:fatty-acyl-CoA synthase